MPAGIDYASSMSDYERREAVRRAACGFPARIQAMLDKIVSNAENICKYEKGSVELSFKEMDVTVKLVQFLP